MHADAARAEPLEAIASFAALLREHGLPVGVAEQQAMVRAALAVPIERAATLDAAWRSIACRDARDWRAWPELFERFWHPERLKGTVRSSGRTRPSRDVRELVRSLQASLGAPGSRPGDTALHEDAGDVDEASAPRARGGASRTDALHDRSLSEWLPQDLAELQRLAERIARRLRRRLMRRRHAHPRGARLDLRRTLRACLATGGTPVAPAWQRPRRERPRLFVLVDVSRSMETHAQLFLRIARSLVLAADARVFVFHTRLAEVTPLLRRDSATVQEKVNAVSAGFGGGTRIATSLCDFHGTHVRTGLGRAARVWVLSDGFDADPPDRLAEEIAVVRARGATVTWFHPSERVPASAAIESARSAIGRFVRLNSLRDLAAAAATIH